MTLAGKTTKPQTEAITKCTKTDYMHSRKRRLPGNTKL